MLKDMQVTAFLGLLASDAPAPGGGSVSALSGALAASLISMVCRLSLGRPELADHHRRFEEIGGQAVKLKEDLTGLVDKDAEAFNEVMAAFKLPKDSDAEKTARSAAIQKGYQTAIGIPLETAALCLAASALGASLAHTFNANAASDLGVAMDCAETGFKGALLNVAINMPSVKDPAYAEEVRRKRADMEKEMALNRALAAERLAKYL